MAQKNGEQQEFKFIEKDGKETVYILQYPGLREAVKIRDRSKNQFGGLVEEKYYEELMKHVIVSPKTNWEYWEQHDGFSEVIGAANTFLTN